MRTSKKWGTQRDACTEMTQEILRSPVLGQIAQIIGPGPLNWETQIFQCNLWKSSWSWIYMIGNTVGVMVPSPSTTQHSQLFLQTTSCYTWVGSEASTLGNQMHLELEKKKHSEISLYNFPSDVLFIKYRVDASLVTLSRSQKASSPAALPIVAFPRVEMWVLSPVTRLSFMEA